MQNPNPDSTSSVLANLIPLRSTEDFSLQKYLTTIQRRWFTIVSITGVAFGLSVLYTARQQPNYWATGKLMFKNDKTPSLIGLKNDDGQLQSLTTKSDPLSTQGEIVRSEPIAKRTIKELQLTDKNGKPLEVQEFQKKLVVKPIIGTDILQISYGTSDPQLAAEVANFVMQAYIERNRNARRSDMVAARQFISEQLPGSREAVSEAELRVRQFKEANGIVELEKEAAATVTLLSTLNQQITQSQAMLAQSTARSTELKNQVGLEPQVALKLTNLNQSENVRRAVSDLQQVRSQLAKERARFTSKSPQIGLLERQEAEANGVLQEQVQAIMGAGVTVSPGTLQLGGTAQQQIATLANAEVERLSLSAQLDALNQARQSYEARSKRLPALEKTQHELERQVDAAQTTYKTLLTKLQEVQVTENQTMGNTEVVAYADPPAKPLAPKVFLNLVIGSGFGLLLGILAALLLDYRDRSIRTVKEARSLFQYPLLGVIPRVKVTSAIADASAIEPVQLSALDDANAVPFPAQEAYQMLNANLKFLASDHAITSIVVTSSVRQEGKSTIAANLAVAMAQVKRRVLLVDADLRNPCQHHAWNLTNQFGLSHVIVGQVPFEQVIHEVTPELHVITAGVVPPNPVALFDSQRMRSLVESFNRLYDVVIFDVPSLSGCADAAILNKMTDGSLIVVRPDVVNAVNGLAAKQFLQQSDQTVLGMVINGIDARQEPSSQVYSGRRDMIETAPKQFAER